MRARCNLEGFYLFLLESIATLYGFYFYLQDVSDFDENSSSAVASPASTSSAVRRK